MRFLIVLFCIGLVLQVAVAVKLATFFYVQASGQHQKEILANINVGEGQDDLFTPPSTEAGQPPSPPGTYFGTLEVFMTDPDDREMDLQNKRLTGVKALIVGNGNTFQVCKNKTGPTDSGQSPLMDVTYASVSLKRAEEEGDRAKIIFTGAKCVPV